MKNRDDSMEWIPLWVDKWIFGSTRIELQPDERAVWVDLMALASKDNGFIRANPETPYPPQQLAGLLCISEELLERSIRRCIETNKIVQCGQIVDNSFRGYFLSNWAEYQLSDRHKRRFIRNVSENEQMSEKKDNMTLKREPIGEDRIGEDIRSTDMKNPFLSVLSESQNPSQNQPQNLKENLISSIAGKTLKSQSKTLDPVLRRVELKEQEKFLKEQEEKK